MNFLRDINIFLVISSKRIGAENTKDEPGASCSERKSEVLQNKKAHNVGDVSNGHKNQLKEIPVVKARTI